MRREDFKRNLAAAGVTDEQKQNDIVNQVNSLDPNGFFSN